MGEKEARFAVECLGEVHEVVLKRGKLGFAAHTIGELELLEALGEEPGCLRALKAFRDGERIPGDPWEKEAYEAWARGWERTWDKGGPAAWVKRRSRLEERPLRSRADARMRRALADVRTKCVNGWMKGLDRWIVLGFVSAAHGGLELPLPSVPPTTGKSRGTVSIWFRLRWLLDVYMKGRSFLDGRLVLGWGEAPLVLCTESETCVARLDGETPVPVQTALPWAEVEMS